MIYKIPNYSNVNSVPPTFVICNSTSNFTLFSTGNEFLNYFSQSLNEKYHRCALTLAVKLPLNSNPFLTGIHIVSFLLATLLL